MNAIVDVDFGRRLDGVDLGRRADTAAGPGVVKKKKFVVRLVDKAPPAPNAVQLPLDLPLDLSNKRIHCGEGLYQNAQTGIFYERVWITGVRTWRSLETSNKRTAKIEMARRRLAELQSRAGVADSPYARPLLLTVGAVVDSYLQAGCPDQHLGKRPDLTAAAERRNCATLLRHFERFRVDDLNLAAMDGYCAARLKEVTKGTGFRTVDLELGTLNNCFLWGVRSQAVKSNPMAARKKYHQAKNVSHCREFMPADADDLHAIVRWIFSTGPRSEAAAWQYLIEALTGLRTAEALSLRTDAGPGKAGRIDVDSAGKWSVLHVARRKKGVNPFVIMTPPLEAALRNLFDWKAARYPESPWFFPSPRDGGGALGKSALVHCLARAGEHFGRKLTSHGARAFYVTVRRSNGINDAQIAIEIGHISGGSVLQQVYGGVPTNWLTGGGPKMAFEPKGEPAWMGLRKATLGQRFCRPAVV